MYYMPTFESMHRRRLQTKPVSKRPTVGAKETYYVRTFESLPANFISGLARTRFWRSALNNLFIFGDIGDMYPGMAGMRGESPK
jgi:hypothetical protein